MMRFNQTVYLGLALLLCFASSLNAQKDSNKMKKTGNGLEYLILRHNEGSRKIQMDDFVILNLSYGVLRNGVDSLIFESATAAADGKMILQVTESDYKGDILEGIAMLSLNDSARFSVTADSFFIKTVRVDQLPPFVKSGEKIYFNIGVHEVLSTAEMQEKQQKLLAKQEEEMKTLTEKEITALRKYFVNNGYNVEPAESGMFIVQTQAGAGENPQNGRKVKVHYTGRLLDGTVFDSSVERGQPFEFQLGAGQVIKGWDIGIAALKPGEKAILGIPSALAYGSRGVGPIPANSPLIFEVELISYE